MHPRKALQELAGDLLALETGWESDFSKRAVGKNTSVLDRSRLRAVDPLSSNALACLYFMDSIVIAVSNSSANVARNQACAHVVRVLRQSQNLLEKLQDLRRNVEQVMSARARTLPEVEDSTDNQKSSAAHSNSSSSDLEWSSGVL